MSISDISHTGGCVALGSFFFCVLYATRISISNCSNNIGRSVFLKGKTFTIILEGICGVDSNSGTSIVVFNQNARSTQAPVRTICNDCRRRRDAGLCRERGIFLCISSNGESTPDRWDVSFADCLALYKRQTHHGDSCSHNRTTDTHQNIALFLFWLAGFSFVDRLILLLFINWLPRVLLLWLWLGSILRRMRALRLNSLLIPLDFVQQLICSLFLTNRSVGILCKWQIQALRKLVPAITSVCIAFDFFTHKITS